VKLVDIFFMDKIAIRVGTRSTDSLWDKFLEGSPNGHFEQCSGWTDAKASDGWQGSRIEILNESRIIGGFQILFRGKGPVRIGYISKGPAIDSENPEALRLAIEQIKSQAAKHRICALLVQPPERSYRISTSLIQNGFLSNNLHRLIEATLLLDMSGSQAECLKQLSPNKRQIIRQSIKRGVTIIEGCEADLPKFFQLMLSTCRRQGNVRPNPLNLNNLMALWKYMQSSGHFRLTFAVIKGIPVSGLLCVIFGDRMTLWKKGWIENHGNQHPNELLYYESIEWARAHGCKTCDFGALDRDIATAILQGENLSTKQMKSRHFFNIGFGGTPELFPPSCIWIPSSITRTCYGLFCYARSLLSKISRIPKNNNPTWLI
jgi:lipid II:glycine glycyltransferase (peptidoglycan interpeptide bridge formation enzyme)